MMKNNQQTLLFDGINEDAYLSEEEERKVISQAVAYINDNGLTPKEADKYLENFPLLRMFANAHIDLLGEAEYRQLEQENIEKIRKRMWEK